MGDGIMKSPKPDAYDDNMGEEDSLAQTIRAQADQRLGEGAAASMNFD